MAETKSLIMQGELRGRERKPNFFGACSARIVSNWVGGGCVKHRVLFRTGWKHIFCIPGFENASPGDGSDCQTG